MEQETAITFGRYIKRLRIERGLTTCDVEQEVGISNSYLGQIEKGVRNPPQTEMLQKLAVLYDVPLESLLTAAGLMDAADKTTFYDADVLKRAFLFVRKDKRLRFGHLIDPETVPDDVKRYVVELYQYFTKKLLLDKASVRQDAPVKENTLA